MRPRTYFALSLVVLALLGLLAGCNTGDGGSDALTERPPPAPDGAATLACTDCHSPGSALDPLVLNGSGADGKHDAHVTGRGYTCETCHADYFADPLHMDGRLNTDEAGAQLVSFSAPLAGAVWTGDTGADTGGCANLYCHGTTVTAAWYDPAPVACEDCHAEGSPIDPYALNGAGTAGKHTIHARTKEYACTDCHYRYEDAPTHVDFTLDTDDPSVDIVGINPSVGGGSWLGDTGAGTGSCALGYCHIVGTPPEWYADVHFACEDCHAPGTAFDPLLTNGTGTAGKHEAHVTTRGYACSTCHLDYNLEPTHVNFSWDAPDSTVDVVAFEGINSGGQWVNDTADGTGGCASTYCHGSGNEPDWYGTGSYDCTLCHVPGGSLDPVALNGSGTAGKHLTHVQELGLPCARCHDGYAAQSTHIDFASDVDNPAATLVLFDSLNPGATWDDSTGTCASSYCHGPSNPQWYASVTVYCTSCHTTGGTAPDPLVTNGTAPDGRHVRHVTELGFGCETCHAGYTRTATHTDATVDTTDPAVLLVRFDERNPDAIWSGDTGSGTGGCENSNCHGTAALDWYGSASWTLPPCQDCHARAIASSRQVLGADGDFGGNAALLSHHVQGGDPTSNQCRVCHAMDAHMQGSVRLREPDTDTPIVYDPAAPTTLEPFCLGCHDVDGATATAAGPVVGLDPFNEGGGGAVLGAGAYIAGDKIDGYWNNAYTVHKDAGLTCTDCHGSAGAVNGHGSVAKGLLAEHLSLPVTSTADFVYEDYRLCLDCHDGYPAVSKEVVLGYKAGGNYDVFWAPTPYYTAGIQSRFRDRYIAAPGDYPAYWSGVDQPYNDSTWGFDPYIPLHNWHLSRYDFFGTGWAYRTGEIGRPNCVTCHNVHGTAGTVRSVYDEFGITAGTGVGGDEYGTMANYTDATLKNYPIGCNQSCHEIAGQLHYWHTPADE